MDIESGFRVAIERDLDRMEKRQVAQGQLLQALALTQSEHSERLTRIESTVESHSFVLADHGLKLSTLQGGVDRIIGMLDTLIAREN